MSTSATTAAPATASALASADAPTTRNTGSLSAEDVVWAVDVDDVPARLHATGPLAAVGGVEGTAWLLDVETGRVRATTPALPGGLLDLALSPGGEHVALAGPAGYLLCDGADSAGRGDRGEPRGESGSWCSAVRWADGNRLAVAHGRTARVLDAAGNTLWQTEPMPSTVTDLVWLRDGRRLAASAYGGVYCFERHSTTPVATYPYGGSHLAIAAASTGRWITTGNQDATVHIWRTRDADELTMSGYPEKVTTLAFDDTGRYLANDGAPDVTVWDFAGKGPSGSSPRMLEAHDAPSALAWRPGTGAVLATAGVEGTVALWRADAGRPGRKQKPLKQWHVADAVTGLAWCGPQRLLVADRSGRITLLRN